MFKYWCGHETVKLGKRLNEGGGNDSEVEADISVMKVDVNVSGFSSKTEFRNFTTPSEQSESSMKTVGVFSSTKQFTPRAKLTTRAVSSTPNQELFNISKITRHVSSQTNLSQSTHDSGEFSDELKYFCLELHLSCTNNVATTSSQIFLKQKITTPGEETEVFSYNTVSSISMILDTASPPKLQPTNKLKFEKTPVSRHKMSTVRKLSLRSKTMISSAMEKSKSKSRIVARHKSVEEKRLFSNTFSLLPQHKTPPSCSEKVLHNPFEKDLQGRLGKSLFSPDVFENVVSPSEDSEYLRWTIEDISSINPVAIDEDFTFPSDDEDPVKESIVQQEIDRYFSETHVVLSPFDGPKPSNFNEIKGNNFYIEAVASTPQKMNETISEDAKSVGTQTALTLPTHLSENVEESLKSYFKLLDTDDLNSSASNLRRKLFFNLEDEPPSPVRFENCPSPLNNDVSKMELSPCVVANNQRHFTPLARQQELSSPELSPVSSQPSTRMNSKNTSITSCKKPLHLYFSGVEQDSRKEKRVASCEMSLDLSSEAFSSVPSSQDTGYQTQMEESSQTSPCKQYHHGYGPSVTASTPTHHHRL